MSRDKKGETTKQQTEEGGGKILKERMTKGRKVFIEGREERMKERAKVEREEGRKEGRQEGRC